MIEIVSRVRAAAAASGVEFEVVPCDPTMADTAAFCEAYGYAMEDSANSIVVIGKVTPPRWAACVLLATTRLDVNGMVRRRLGVKKASFASPDETLAVTGMELGGVTAFGLPPEVPLWVDAAVMDRPRVVLGGGDRSSKLLLAPRALLSVPGAEVVEGLAR